MSSSHDRIRISKSPDEWPRILQLLKQISTAIMRIAAINLLLLAIGQNVCRYFRADLDIGRDRRQLQGSPRGLEARDAFAKVKIR